MYAFFAPAFNVATNDNFDLLAPGIPPLSIYATDFYFAAGFTGISVVKCTGLVLLLTVYNSHASISQAVSSLGRMIIVVTAGTAEVAGSSLTINILCLPAPTTLSLHIVSRLTIALRPRRSSTYSSCTARRWAPPAPTC